MFRRVRNWKTAVLAIVAAGAVTAAGCDSPTGPSGNVPFSTTDLVVGTGAQAQTGLTISVQYTGWLYSASATDNKGEVFDTNVGASPFVFTLGVGQVIEGWDQGLPGMRVGGRRRLVVPPSLAYGADGVPGVIPPNSTLVFEVDLLGVAGVPAGK